MRPLKTYEDWKHCIIKLCRIELTEGFVKERLAELRDADCYSTQKFVSSWGDRHRKQVIAWFEQAQDELAMTTSSTS